MNNPKQEIAEALQKTIAGKLDFIIIDDGQSMDFYVQFTMLRDGQLYGEVGSEQASTEAALRLAALGWQQGSPNWHQMWSANVDTEKIADMVIQTMETFGVDQNQLQLQ